jgi:hypothetical protein
MGMEKLIVVAVEEVHGEVASCGKHTGRPSWESNEEHPEHGSRCESPLSRQASHIRIEVRPLSRGRPVLMGGVAARSDGRPRPM